MTVNVQQDFGLGARAPRGQDMKRQVSHGEASAQLAEVEPVEGVSDDGKCCGDEGLFCVCWGACMNSANCIQAPWPMRRTKGPTTLLALCSVGLHTFNVFEMLSQVRTYHVQSCRNLMWITDPSALLRRRCKKRSFGGKNCTYVTLLCCCWTV